MSTSAIEWTEQTWNPVTGCTKVSAGCKYCYAEVMAKRLQAMGASGYENGFTTRVHASRLKQPLQRKKPTMYFVNSMSDLFHPDVPFSFIDKIFETISCTPQHTYQILTKRPKTMRQYFAKRQVPDNVWLGTSAENQKHGVPRIEILSDIDAKVRFLSCEPLLEDLGRLSLGKINWVIVGGESGCKARPMQQAWIENIQNQCKDQRVAFFFKQWGTWGNDGIKRSKKVNGRLLRGKTWDEYPLKFVVAE